MIALALALSFAVVAASPETQDPAHPPPPPNCAAQTTFVGTVCTPAVASSTAVSKHRAVILLGGSDGGDSVARAAPEFAAHNYVAVSVAYFGAGGLPGALQNIPVETIGKAIQAVASRSDVDPQRIAVFGVSKGGELALLVASQYPQVRAVIAGVPSPFAWQGIPTGPSSVVTSSWTVGGKPVPFVPYTSGMGAVFQKAFTNRTPIVMRSAYEDARKNDDAVTKAFFHIENVRGPILFLSAGDDQIWDSAAQSTMAMGYLKRHKHAYPDEHATYPDAGHLFLFASTYFPATQIPFGGGVTLVLGGTAQANVTAAGEAWPRIFSFLYAALR